MLLKELSVKTGYSIHSLRKFVRENKLPSIKKGRDYHVKISDFNNFVKATNSLRGAYKKQ